ncbi:hypothetical protein BACT_0710 [Bifidobacterium actinocoloniiforme DSM 22766]|uniref:Uncharacterized protein n=1 Tax=Bifidobacterium actinocoloniiforme DSM 22766 TaxID=1437605 RepID=A0A086Z0F8_9BIFI|nr:hypothetical protein BACT_0710 [Bifidobacterium actinocoloniiforme DSM 22766]
MNIVFVNGSSNKSGNTSKMGGARPERQALSAD